MKVLYLLISMTFITISSFAQVQLYPQKPRSTVDFLNLHKPVQKMNLIVYPKATFTGSYATGKIYRLPLDNMPCLVPDTRLLRPIPNAGTRGFQNSLMLNPYKKEDLIPVE